MPLTPRASAHIRSNLRRIFAGRTTGVTLHFSDGTTLVVQAIWKTPELDDPEMPTIAKDFDALMQVNLQDVTLAQLEGAVWVTPSSFEGADTFCFSARYLIGDVQPKGLAWPPNRAHVYLQKAE